MDQIMTDQAQEQGQTLAQSLLIKGELALLQGDLVRALDLFDSASKLDSENPELYYRQGLSLFEYGSTEERHKALLLASKKFKMALALDPDHFDGWQAWGNTLQLLGKVHQEHHYFLEADEKYKKAVSLIETCSSDTAAYLYWDLAVTRTRIAEHSEEALDFHLAMDAFQKSSSLNEKLPHEFWHDFGLAALALASRINDVRLYIKAINCFKYSLSSAHATFDGWVALGTALQMLYGHTHDEDHFVQATECFVSASQLKPHDPFLELNWARFLMDAGRQTKDLKKLRSCIEKCSRSLAMNPEKDFLVLAIWAESLALMGELTERIDLLHEAQNKIAEASESEEGESCPDICYSHGMCLSSFAAYFNDFDLHYQAIEKFQQGLSIDRTSDRNWHGLAKTYTIVGLLEHDAESLEKSLRFYNKAIDLKASSYYIFDYAVALTKLGEMTGQKKWVEEAMLQFERALGAQKNAIYLHPDWLFHYGLALDTLGDFYEEEFCYAKAIEIFSHVLMIDPDFPHIHHRLALAFFHLGELLGEVDNYYRAIHHFRLGAKREEENDQIIVDLALTLINLAEYSKDALEEEQLYREAEHKLTQAAKLGNAHAYYHLGCLYSLLGHYEKSMRFIEKAKAFDALPPLDELLHDDWLEGVRTTGDFREFVSLIEKRAALKERPTEK